MSVSTALDERQRRYYKIVRMGRLGERLADPIRICVALGIGSLAACARGEQPEATAPDPSRDGDGLSGAAATEYPSEQPTVPPSGGAGAVAPGGHAAGGHAAGVHMGGATGTNGGPLDPVERNRELALLDVSDAPDRPICDGSDAFTFQRANWNKGWEGSAFGLLWRNGYAFLRIDGHCRYFAYQATRQDPVITGSLSEQDAVQLAADVEYAGWPLLDGLTATGGAPDNALEQLDDGTHGLYCARGCREAPSPQDAEATARLTTLLDAADRWQQRLLAEGTGMEGDVRVAIELKEDVIHSGGYLEWPLAEPIENYLVGGTSEFEEAAGPVEGPAGESASVSDGVLVQGEDAGKLRALRSDALRTATPGAITEGWIAIDAPGELFYEVVVADALPYEGADGRVSRPASD